MIIPDKPCAADEIQESQPGDNQKIPASDGGEAPANGTGGAGDGLRCLSVTFTGGFDFVFVNAGEVRGGGLCLIDCVFGRGSPCAVLGACRPGVSTSGN